MIKELVFVTLIFTITSTRFLEEEQLDFSVKVDFQGFNQCFKIRAVFVCTDCKSMDGGHGCESSDCLRRIVSRSSTTVKMAKIQ